MVCSITDGGSLAIGGEQDNVDGGYTDAQDFRGDIAEVIIFGSYLTNPQRTIVENYLNQKYGITIANDYFGNDVASYDDAYDHDIRGIGSDGTDTRTNSGGSDGLTVRESAGSLDADEYIMFAHNDITHADGITTEIADATNITDRWARDWHVEVNQGGGAAGVDGGDVNVEMIFDFGESGLSYGSLADYVLLYRGTVTGDFDRVYADSYTLENSDQVVVSVPSSRLKTGYYTLGTGNPLIAKTWYAFKNGDWSDPGTWTTDASTAPLFKNDSNEIPTAADEVIIRSGRTITIQPGTNGQEVNTIKVDGNLNITTSTGHDFNIINGGGVIRMAGYDSGSGLVDNFPEGTVIGNIGFADADNGGTVIVDAVADITLTAERTFRNLHVELANANDTVILANNIILNENLEVKNGKFQFGEGTTDARTLSVRKDVIVATTGAITTANANARHTFTIQGDFTNNGDVRFTNRADFASDTDRRSPSHSYYTAEATDGIVDVVFANDNADQTVYCYNTTYFYRVVIDKGIDDTYILGLRASDADYFRLLGYANDNVDSDLQTAAQNTNAFALVNGTARIDGNVEIPVLNRATNYAISSTTRLWINGGDVRKTSTTAIVPYGTVQVSSGYLEATGNSGLTLRQNGLIRIEGGNVLTSQIRTSIQGVGSLGGYNQSGGTVMVDGDLGGGASGNYYTFSLTYAGNVFIMSGGDLTVSGANSRGAIFINSDPGNIDVTGGTVTIASSNANVSKVTSRAPFYNANMRANGASVGNIELDEGTSGTGGGAVTLGAQSLVVLNDLVVQGYGDTYKNNPLGNFPVTFAATTSDTNINDVYVGGSFYVGRNSTYQCLFGGAPSYDGLSDLPTHYNTTYFNETLATSAIDTVYWGVTGSGVSQLEMGSFILDRTSGYELRTIARNGNSGSIRFDINGDMSVLSGTLDQNAYTFRIWGSITNNDRLGTYYSSGSYPVAGGTPSLAQIRFREDPPLVISTDENAVFGNIRFNVGAGTTITFDSDVYVERMEYMNGRIYVKNHTLTVDEIWNINNGGGSYFDNDVANSSIIRVNNTGIIANILVFTDGKASDGGLKLKVSGNTVAEDETSRINNNGPITFPVGFTSDGGTTFISRPAQMKVKDFTDDGYVQINVVSGELQTSDLTGGEILQHYWRVRHDGFTSLPTVGFRFYYRGYGTAVAGRDRPAGTSSENDYVPGYVLDGGNFNRYFESDPAEDKTDIFTSTAPNSGNQNANENNRTRIITFNGADTGGEFTQAGFDGFELNEANFTAGVSNRFLGAPEIFYTTNTSLRNWNNGTKWTTNTNGTDDGANEYPQTGDIAILKSYGNGNGNHWVYGNIDITVAELIFDNTEGGWGPRLWMTKRDAQLDLGPVSGTGTIFLEVTAAQIPSFIGNTDLGAFSNEPGSVFNFKIDADNQTVSMPNNIPVYPNIRIEAGNGNNDDDNRILQTSIPITVNGYIRMDRSPRFRVNHDVLVKDDVRVTWQANRTTLELGDDREVTLEIQGDLRLENGDGNDGARVLVKNNNQNSYEHTIKVGGNIEVEANLDGTSTLDLFNGAAPNNNAILELSGETTSSFTNSSTGTVIPDLYKIVINKGNVVDSSFTFNNTFNLPLPTTIGSQPVEVLNGTLVLNDNGIDVTLTDNARGNFNLPNTTNVASSSGSGGLEIRQGIARIDGDDTGIILDGLLRISGGELDMDDATSNGNNFIEYSSSGEATINITSGLLTVGSQIRRGTNSTTGVLRYSQRGGTVVIGKNAAPTSTRGVFEVTNSGSAFDHTGGSFTIVRDNNSTTVASLLLEPASSNIADGTVITIGNGDTPSNQGDRFGIQSSVGLAEIALASSNIKADLYNLPLSTDILDITAGATFDANGFNLTIGENLNNDGTFSTSGNSINDQFTYFPTATTATITGTGTTNFWNFEKPGSGALTLSKSVTVDNNAFIYAGTLNTQTSAFNIKKDLLHDATHTSAAAGPGIVFNGGQRQNLDRSGPGESILGVMELDNAAGLIITDTEENFRINEKLTLSAGVFDMGGNLLIFPENAFIENGSGGTAVTDFNVNNMIQTNSSIRDFGIRKYYNAVSGGNVTFTYPVGLVAYTPAVITINDMSAGYITIRPVRDVPPITEDIEDTDDAGTGACTDPNISDAGNVLQYYWIVKSSGISGFNGELLAYYDAADVKVTSPYTVANYGPARIYNSSSNWDKVFTTTDFNEASQRIYYPFTGNGDATLEGIYTAGVTLRNDGTSLLCGGAIPDQVPEFITNDTGGGNFFTNTTYIGGVAPVAGESPDILVRSGDVLLYGQNSIRTRKITIESGGTLVIQNGTNNHNLGFVTGEGTIRLESDGSSVLFPTGDYEDFFPDATCSGGGGLEYAGMGTYAVLSDLPNIRRVVFSGSGSRTLPNNFALNVCEDFDIRGTVSVVIPDGNNTISVWGNVYKSDGASFDNGGGNARIVMTGTAPQSIQGDFTAINALNGLRINNAAGVTIANSADGTRGISANQDVEIEDALLFASGVVTTNANNSLRMLQGATSSGYSSSSHVSGPLQAVMSDNDNFVFPVGKGNRLGVVSVNDATHPGQTLTWQAEYFNRNAEDDGQVSSMTATSDAAILSISLGEYWIVTDDRGATPSGSPTATIGLRWDTSSDAPGDISTLATMVWDGAEWDNYGGKNHSGNTAAGDFLSSSYVPFSSKVITMGSTEMSVLPVELISFKAVAQEQTVQLVWETASEINNDYFEVLRSIDGINFKKIGEVAGAGNSSQQLRYEFVDKLPMAGVAYYQLKQVDYNGMYDYSDKVSVEWVNTGEYAAFVELNLYPNPAPQGEAKLRVTGLRPRSTATVKLLDMFGKVHLQQVIEADRLSEDGYMIRPRARLSSGVYVVSVQQGSQIHQKTLIVR